MPKLYVEASEVMASVAMLMKPDKLNEYSKDFQGLVTFLKEGKKLANSNKIAYGTFADKREFLKAFNPSERDYLREAAIGISAARSIRGWVPGRSKESGVPITNLVVDKVYLTGDTWPKDVQKFQVEAYGFKSYNSSDIIFQWKNPKGLSYYGVSLKKKPTAASGDPTLINKAFDSALQGENYDGIKKEVVQSRIKYFAKVVREATKTKPPGDKNPYLTVIGGNLPSNDESLMKISLLERRGKPRRSLIDLKGKGTVDLSDLDNIKFHHKILGPDYTKAQMKDEKISMRAFVNKRIASRDSVYSAMVAVMNKYSEVFAKSLLNLVLKADLYSFVDKDTFAFALVTGIGDIDKEGNPKIGFEKAKGLHTVLCGISALNKGSKKYQIILDDEANKKSSGAKVYLKLIKGNITVLNMELRYKGSFTPQPQFFATLSDDFKTLLYDKCMVPK
tara:strand:+ start:36 stop:1379 length:1344 start_codon:yes stop_codon:yes gene_type:complete